MSRKVFGTVRTVLQTVHLSSLLISASQNKRFFIKKNNTLHFRWQNHCSILFPKCNLRFSLQQKNDFLDPVTLCFLKLSPSATVVSMPPSHSESNSHHDHVSTVLVRMKVITLYTLTYFNSGSANNAKSKVKSLYVRSK